MTMPLLARRRPTRAGHLRVEVLEGPGVLEQLGDRLDDLMSACGAPVTARRRWLAAWLRSFPEWRPVAVTVSRGDGALAAAALLARRRRIGGTTIVAVGDGACDRSRLYACDQAAAGELAASVVAWLKTLRAPWTLTLRQMPAGDPATTRLCATLPYAALRPAVGSPCVAFGEDRRPGGYISANARGQARNKWNRLEKNGLEPTIETTASPDAIAQLLPRIMEIARVRQEELTGRRKLDDPRRAAFFRDIVSEHARQGEVEVLLLRLRGEIAGYTLSFLDGDTARMWSGHYDPQWSVYSPGHILACALVERCLERPRLRELDWMLGMEAYKLRFATRVDEMESLYACSGRAAWAARSALHRARTYAKATRDRHAILRRLQLALRRIAAGSLRAPRGRADG